MEAKPICVVYVPIDAFDIGGRKVTWKDLHEMIEHHEKIKPDYHWFFLPDNNAEKIEFKVFYEKDFTPIQYEELKKLIEQATETEKPS